MLANSNGAIMKYIIGTIGVLLVIMLGWAMHVQSSPPVRRDTAVRRHGDRIYAPGRVEGLTSEIELRPVLEGRIAKMHCKEGEIVPAGQILLQLEDEKYRHEVALAEAQLQVAEAKLQRLLDGAHPQERNEASAIYEARTAEMEGARLNSQRNQQLRKDDALSQQAFDDQQSRLQSLIAQVAAAKARMELLQAPPRDDEIKLARAEIAAAKARLELAKVQLKWTELCAPRTATVLRVNVEAGELTGPTAREPAVLMSDMQRLRVRAFVEEFDAPRLRAGISVIVTADGLPGKQFTGHVARLSPHMTSRQIWNDEPAEHLDTKMREVWIDLEQTAGLVFGLRVDVIILMDR